MISSGLFFRKEVRAEVRPIAVQLRIVDFLLFQQIRLPAAAQDLRARLVA
jgi:hypothetical protein